MWRSLNKRTSRWWPVLSTNLGICSWRLGLPWRLRDEKIGPPQEAQVSRVIDGDTLVLEGGTRVRLLGIDAPEMERDGHPAEFLAHKAKAALSDLTQNGCRLEYDQCATTSTGPPGLPLPAGPHHGERRNGAPGAGPGLFHCPQRSLPGGPAPAQREAMEAHGACGRSLKKNRDLLPGKPHYLASAPAQVSPGRPDGLGQPGALHVAERGLPPGL